MTGGSSGEPAPQPNQTAFLETRTCMRRHARGILLQLVTLALLAGGVEGVARVIVAHSRDPMLQLAMEGYAKVARGRHEELRFVPDETIGYRLRPSVAIPSPNGRGTTRHNAQGFRDDADFGPKRPGVMRVVCLGGSTTYGVSVAENPATYPACLERYLNDSYRPPAWSEVEAFNLGVGGYTSGDILTNLLVHALPLEPDVVLVQCAINDVTPRFYPDFAADYSHFRKPLRLCEPGVLARLAYRSQAFLLLAYRSGLIAPLTLQARTQHPMPPPYQAAESLKRNGPEAFSSNIQRIVEECRSRGIDVWLLTEAYYERPDVNGAPLAEYEPLYRQGLREHNDELRRLAAEMRVGLIDLDRLTPRLPRYFSDPIHMTEAGNLVKARCVAEALSGRLPKPKGQP